jgi:hypothetical protein
MEIRERRKMVRLSIAVLGGREILGILRTILRLAMVVGGGIEVLYV